MTDKRAIGMAALLGGVVLLLMCIVLRPFSRFAEEYPMAAASGSAVSGASDEAGVTVSGVAADSSSVSGSPAAVSDSVTHIPLVHASGKTLETRVDTPAGFKRTQADADSLTTFLRTYKLYEDGAPVKLYNKELKGNQNAHVAVFKLPIEKEDLQQCADSVMRVYAEYFLKTGQIDRIAFSLTKDFTARYSKWREGYRIHESDGTFVWSKDTGYDDSKKTFKKFMRLVFAYSGSYQVADDAKKIKNANDIRVGDIFIKGGAPGHVVMVVDTCESADGRKAFLLAQGYMPAQQFHLLKNTAHEDDPWYYVDEITYPFETPEYTFKKGSLKRPEY